MAKMKKIPLKINYVQVPNETAKAVEKKASTPISLQALGLITNLWSYDVENWDLYKKELYNRYSKNKETSVRNAWNELVEAKYIVEFQYRNSEGKFDNTYYYRIEPFTDEEIKAINEAEKTALENPVRENQSGKTGMENHVVSNEKEIQEKEQNKNQERLNSNPYSLSEEIFKLSLPMPIRKLIDGNREKIMSLNVDIYEIERFYNTYDLIDEFASKDDYEHINKWDFEALILYIFKNNIQVQKTTFGLLKEMAHSRLFYKQQNHESFAAIKENVNSNNDGAPFYDWLNAE